MSFLKRRIIKHETKKYINNGTVVNLNEEENP